jgi:hypothetical protein
VTDTVTSVYDATGNLAAEYETGGNSTSPCGTATCYVAVDQLGSTRLLMDSAGNAVRRYDYYPWGAEIFAGTVGRTTGTGYQASANEEKLGTDGTFPESLACFRPIVIPARATRSASPSAYSWATAISSLIWKGLWDRHWHLRLQLDVVNGRAPRNGYPPRSR